MIYPIFAKDFHLKNKIINQEDISQTIEILKNKSLLDEDENGNILSPDENSSYFQNYIALSHLCEPSLKRFYIVMHTMWQSGSIQKDDLNTRCKELAENLEEIEGWPYPEFSDKAKFDNFVHMMKETKFFKEDESGYLSASKITKRANKLYEQFFDKEFLEFIGTQTS
jgi:glycerol-3-phosphate O-acyltransferase